MDYRRGVPLFLSRGLLSTDYELTGYRLHRYRLYRIFLGLTDDLHELFNCLTVCYYHTHLIGYAALLVTLFASFAPSVYFIS